MEPVKLAEYEHLARQRLPKMAYDYIAGGAEDEATLRENEAAFQRIKLRPRVLMDVARIDSSTHVLGQRVECPILLAPVAIQQLAHPEGERATARAAAAAGTIMVLSTMSHMQHRRSGAGSPWAALVSTLLLSRSKSDPAVCGAGSSAQLFSHPWLSGCRLCGEPALSFFDVE